MIHCDCDHTSVFSAGLFVPPNQLEPIDPAKVALMFFQNPLILITCAIIWVIYFVTLIYARVLDKKEEEKVRIYLHHVYSLNIVDVESQRVFNREVYMFCWTTIQTTSTSTC